MLWKGKIVESGPSEELFNPDNEFVSQFLNAETQGPLAMDEDAPGPGVRNSDER